MELARPQLTVLLNALYDTDTMAVTLAHPGDDVGDLLAFDLDDADASTVRFPKTVDDYAAARTVVANTHGSPAVDELPSARSFISAMLAGGLVDPPNRDDIDAFLDQNGYPDLSAGHRPVVAGFDTNLLPWRIADVLGLDPGRDAAVNGYVLATGVRDELDWDAKRSTTRPLVAAFGDAFEQLWNQPAGARRQGRLGETHYRRLRDHRYAEEVPTDRGDEAIVAGYDGYGTESRKDVVLFTNDRDVVERAISHRVPAQRVEFPDALPRSVEASWTAIQDTLYVLAVLFGVLVLPKVTLYGVWKGKGGEAWQEERLKVDCRSPRVEELIERDLEILDGAGS